jgi:DNA-binding response OmpR family regulator
VCIIPDRKPVVHPVCSRRIILYAGHDLLLLQFLQHVLEDCQVVRCPDGSLARSFIKKIKYWLLLVDEELPDMTGPELADFTRGVQHREQTLIMILSAGRARGADGGIFFEQPDDPLVLVSAIQQLLGALQ